MNTVLSEALELARIKETYDNSCKRILANKEIAARILKEVVSEYKDCCIADIKQYISDVDIGNVPVDVDSLPPNINLENSEDNTLNEGSRSFDIKFTAKAPGDENTVINLIINIEAQRNYHPGYSLLKRGIYYCCRLISSQYGTVFTKSDYDKLRKVYSIWVCPNPTGKFKNTINKYSLHEEALYGAGKTDSKEDYDLITLIMICLDSGEISSDNSLIELLSSIFSSKLKLADKRRILEEKFNIPMTTDIDEEVEAMCNLSEDIYDKGIEQGIEKGIEQGIEKGIEQGIAKGAATLLKAMIKDRLKNNEPESEILEELGRYGATQAMLEEIRSGISDSE